MAVTVNVVEAIEPVKVEVSGTQVRTLIGNARNLETGRLKIGALSAP
jgi:hypothetical protein